MTQRPRLLAAALLGALALGAATATPATAATGVDAVATPKLAWAPCDYGECATMRVPMDYRNITGPTVEVAVARIPAREPGRRIGSLFLNPGGPGAGGQAFLLRAREWLSPEIQDRFDLIGMDPRGVDGSEQTECFATVRQLGLAMDLQAAVPFPVTSAEEKATLTAARRIATACSSSGKPLTLRYSTTEVARDMDVLRRALGEDRLNYLGFSYGTYLGQVYASLFPGRFRALVLDGVVDPVDWQGTPATASTPMSVRMGSAKATSDALAEVLRRCEAAGDACPLPDATASFRAIAERLKASPLPLPNADGTVATLTYQQFVSAVQFSLYSDRGAESVPALAAMVGYLQSSPPQADRLATASAYRKATAATPNRPGYSDAFEIPLVAMCSDSLNPEDPGTWPRLAPGEDAKAPYFGRAWLWGTAACASRHWKAVDTDAYHGPFAVSTANPVLVVGNLHDPATPYANAEAVAVRLPNARLLSSTNWGHTAYAVSACATAQIDAYLLDGTLPPEGTLCSDGYEPFQP